MNVSKERIEKLQEYLDDRYEMLDFFVHGQSDVANSIRIEILAIHTAVGFLGVKIESQNCCDCGEPYTVHVDGAGRYFCRGCFKGELYG